MTKQPKHTEIKKIEEEVQAVEDQSEVAADSVPEAADEQAVKIEELQTELNKYKDLYIRSQAEMENLRRRTQIELEKRSKFAISSFAKDLLSVSDNLSRAMSCLPESEREKESEQVKNLMVGLELTKKDLEGTFERNGITAVESLGRVFDPNVHKVVQEIEDLTKPAGTIIQEWQKGYLIGGDRVLREAVVIVAKGGPKPGEEPAEAGHSVDTSA